MPIIEGSLERGAGYNAKLEGVPHDGSTDGTTALQTLVTKSITNGDPINFARGSLILSDSIYIGSSDALVWRGAGGGLRGNRGTQLQWAGPSDVPLLRVQDVNHAHFMDFSFKGNATYPLHSFAWLENLTATGVTTQQRTIWDNIALDGGATSGANLGRGWVARAETGDSDANNDFHSFNNCQVANYNVLAWAFNHSQSKAHQLWNCSATPNNTTARALVAAGYDWDPAANGGLGAAIAVSTGGSFNLYGFQGSRGAEASFLTSVNGDECNIYGANLEQVVRLLVSGISGPGSTFNPNVNLNGIRASFINSTANGSTLHADGFFLIQHTRGPITMRGCRLENFSGAAPQIQQDPNGSGGYGTVSVEDSYIESESAVLFGSQTSVARGRIRNVSRLAKSSGVSSMYADGDYGAGPLERWGAGSPEGVLVAPPGSVFHRSDGGTGTSLYVKEANTTANGWVAK